MTKSKKNKNKAKLNLTVRDEQRDKLEQMASLEKRSVSNLIEVMADERWGQSNRPREIAPSSSRSCRREKNAKVKRRFPQSLTAIFVTG
jgi:predicted CopG family antitoxin